MCEKTSQLPLPKHLLIETTTRCNLRCKQCAHVVNKYALADMSMETFHQLTPLFPHADQVALYGHGETFLHHHFFEMLAELKKYDPFVYVTTNGTLIMPEVAERLVELKLDRLAFSLDAATPELFNEIRRGADLLTCMGISGAAVRHIASWAIFMSSRSYQSGIVKPISNFEKKW